MAVKATATQKEKWTAADVFSALSVIHPGPEEWVLLREVPDATSWSKTRTADAIAFGCWRSVGIAIHGYEIKVARADWLREIQQPEKSEAFVQRCNYWWVAAPEGVVKPEEMPANWGLREVRRQGDSFSVKVRKAATHNPEPKLDVAFACALARCAFRRAPAIADHEKALKRAKEEGIKEGEELQVRRNGESWLKRDFDELKESVEKFEKESGVKIDVGYSWNVEECAKAVKAYLEFGSPVDVFSKAEKTLSDLLEKVRKFTGTSP